MQTHKEFKDFLLDTSETPPSSINHIRTPRCKHIPKQDFDSNLKLRPHKHRIQTLLPPPSPTPQFTIFPNPRKPHRQVSSFLPIQALNHPCTKPDSIIQQRRRNLRARNAKIFNVLFKDPVDEKGREGRRADMWRRSWGMCDWWVVGFYVF